MMYVNALHILYIICCVSIFEPPIITQIAEFIGKIWMVNRLSPQIGLSLYGLYVLVFQLLDLFRVDDTNRADPVTIILLSARFASFCSELLMNFYIDKEIENDLLKECIHPMEFNLKWAWMFFFVCSPACCEEMNTCCNKISVNGDDNDNQPLLQNRQNPLPEGWQFKGSICAWTCDNVFRAHITKPNTYCIGYRFVFRLVLIPTILPAIVLMILMGFWILVQSLFCRFTLCCRCVCNRQCEPIKGSMLGEIVYDHEKIV